MTISTLWFNMLVKTDTSNWAVSTFTSLSFMNERGPHVKIKRRRIENKLLTTVEIRLWQYNICCHIRKAYYSHGLVV